MMDKETYIEIAGKVADGTASENEIALYNSYFNAYQLKYPSWNRLNDLQRQEMIGEAEKRIHLQLGESGDKRQVKLWPRIAAVAAAVALIVLGVYFFKRESGILKQVQDDVVVNDIAPGKNGATITLANGKVIQLSDAKSGVVIGDDKLAYNDGSPLSPQGGSLPEGESGAGAKDMTASTTKGQTYIFTLPDGTKVWLNAASTLTIPSDFSGTESRKVALTGEAYFEVAKNKKRPFIVATAGGNGVPGQEVTVLGTHFNINSYKDQGSVRTTLLEGSVRVASLSPPYEGGVPNGRGGKEETNIVLKPNQQSLLSGSNRLEVKEIDPETAVAWKEGFFKFNEERLDEIMMKVSRWYDVEISYAEPNLKSRTFNGTVSRFSNVSQLLKKLELTGAVHFKIEGRRIVVDR